MQPGLTVQHLNKCENKRCVNPEHLELVTNTVNLRLYHRCKPKKLVKNINSKFIGV